MNLRMLKLSKSVKVGRPPVVLSYFIIKINCRKETKSGKDTYIFRYRDI